MTAEGLTSMGTSLQDLEIEPKFKDHDNEDSGPLSDQIDSVLARARLVLEEIQTFQAYLDSIGIRQHLELAAFKGYVAKETRNMDRKLSSRGNDESSDPELSLSTRRSLSGSNLPYYMAVWDHAKRCRGIKAVSKRVHFGKPGSSGDRFNKTSAERSLEKVKSSVPVDIVSENGEELIKVITTNEKRLIFEMAKEGLGYDDMDDSDESSDEEQSGSAYQSSFRNPENDSNRGIRIVRLAQDLYRASLHAWTSKYTHPRIQIILPNLTIGRVPQIDVLLSSIRAISPSITLITSTDLPLQPPVSLSPSTLKNMAPSLLYPKLTATLNLDCTILLALISDFSHSDPSNITILQTTNEASSNPRGHHANLLSQIEREAKDPLLPNKLYPLLCNHKLICSAPAARRCQEIVDTIATDSERKRCAAIFGLPLPSDLTANPDPNRNLALDPSSQPVSSPSSSIKTLTSLSDHPLPPSLHFPIQMLPFSPPSPNSSTHPESPYLPTSASSLTPHLSPINQSVFLFGWAHRATTVTSNRTVGRDIHQRLIEFYTQHAGGSSDNAQARGNNDDEDGEAEMWWGPRMCYVEPARSLVGKELGVKEKERLREICPPWKAARAFTTKFAEQTDA
ncbi:MAG: hypothetical protein Q9227_008403 [Pyrenula ochraceoflavens]